MTVVQSSNKEIHIKGLSAAIVWLNRVFSLIIYYPFNFVIWYFHSMGSTHNALLVRNSGNQPRLLQCLVLVELL